MLNIFLDFYIKFTSAILTFAVYGTERNTRRSVATQLGKMALPPVGFNYYNMYTLVAASDGSAGNVSWLRFTDPRQT